MERLAEKLRDTGFEGEIKRDVFMRDHTSLKIGGRCKLMIEPFDPYSLKLLVELLCSEGQSMVVIGGGTNLLVSDEGVDDVVVRLRGWRKVEVVESYQDKVVVFAEAGTPLQTLLNFCTEKGLSGLEGLVGIPGTLGGAVSGNAGAFGYEIMDRVDRITVMDGDRMEVIKREALTPDYRDGAVRGIILAVHLRLFRDDIESIKKRTMEFLETKKATQPLNEHSAGCVFKNPEGYYAGKLIEEAGLKGLRMGDIEVSRKHANFFINLGKGTSKDFIDLMKKVQEEVQKRFSVVLEPEIKMIGQGINAH
jgi:UDP-N-acetylmuramate dehydrogenase